MDYSGAINNNESFTDLADQLSIIDDQNTMNDHYTSTMNRLNRMYIENRLTDVTLVCGANNQTTIKAHRVVLSSVSDYFYAMFNNDLLESRKTEIVINDVESSALTSLIDYIYSGSIELNESNIYAILSAATMLQLDKIVKLGCNYLLKNLNISNCISTFRFSEKYLFNELNEISKQYILDNFTSLIYTLEFNELSYQEIELFLSNNDLNINNEEFAFEALIKWINNDLTSRLCYLSKLLAFIKLPLLNPLYLTQQIETNKLIAKSSSECQNLLLEAMTYHILKSYQQHTNNFNPRTIPRRSTVGCLLAIGGIVNTNETVKGQAIEKYDCRLDKWSIHNYMNSRRLQCGVVLIDHRLYIVGGREGLKTLSSVEYYDFEKQVWSSVNSMNTHRHGLGASFFNSLLYAIGGHDGWSFLNTCERFELETSTWTIVAPMLNSRSTLGVAALNNRLYAIGGRDSSTCLKVVEYYNPNNNKWIQCASMIKRRGSVGVTALNDYIYAVGGHELPNTLLGCNRWDCAERYDSKIDQWTLIASMSKPKEAVGVSSLGNYLYVVGGFDGNKYLNDVERYDPCKNEWKKVQSLNMLRAGTSLIHVKNEVLNKELCKSTITQIVDDSSIFKKIKYNFLNEINKTNSSHSSASSTPPLSKSLSCDYGANNNNNDNNSVSAIDDNIDESSFHTI